MCCNAFRLVFQVIHIFLSYLLNQILAIHLNIPLIENIARHALRIAIHFVKACREVSTAHVVSVLNIFPVVYSATRDTSAIAICITISQSDILRKHLIQFLYQSSLACLPFLWFVCFLFLHVIHSQGRRTRTATNRTKIYCATITPYLVYRSFPIVRTTKLNMSSSFHMSVLPCAGMNH